MSILSPHRNHADVVQVLTKDEGGRYTPFVHGYSPQLFLRTADITTSLTWPEDVTDTDRMVDS